MTDTLPSAPGGEIVTHHDERGCPVLDLSTFSEEVASDPHPFYAALHRQCPVASVPISETAGTYLLSRYEDVQFALRHPEVFSSDDAVDIGQERPLIPLQIDPPDHVRWRRLLDPFLAPKQVAPLEADFRRLVNDLIDGFVDDGEVAVHDRFSMPLPCTMFLRLLGLPLDEMATFVRWKDGIIRPEVEMGDAEGAARIRARTGQEMYAYFAEAIADRRARPRDDLLTRIVQGEVDGRAVTHEELLDIMYVLLLGGLDTVTATLDCTLGYLAAHPARREELVAHPDRLPAAVEELLRFHTPVMLVMRTVRQPVELSGVAMQPGDTAMVAIGAANLDGDMFAEAGQLRYERPENKHLAFGGGPHRCLGSHFARLELRVALEEWHKRIPSYRLVDGASPSYTFGIREAADLRLAWSDR